MNKVAIVIGVAQAILSRWPRLWQRALRMLAAKPMC